MSLVGPLPPTTEGTDNPAPRRLPHLLRGPLRFLDRLRRSFWRLFLALRLGNILITDRSARVVAYALFGMSFAFACTLFAPLWLLLIGPLILGTPHIVSDIRYLLLRPPQKVERLAIWGILLPLGGLTLVRIAMMSGWRYWPSVEIAFGCGAVLGAVATSRADHRVRLGLLVLLAACSMWLVERPWQTILGLGHLHNLVAFGLWLWWSRGEGPWWRYVGVVVFYIGIIGILASGLLEPFAASLGAYRGLSNGFDLDGMVRTLAPGVSPVWGLRIVLIYAFAQAVHYTIWLRLVPNNHHFYPRKGPSTFHRNLESLRVDFGTLGLWLIILSCLAVPFVGLFDAVYTRSAYLTLIAFHGWLEIAIIAHLLCNALQPASNTSPKESTPS